MPNTVTLTERGVWIMATINGVEHYLCLVTEADAVEYALRERRLENVPRGARTAALVMRVGGFFSGIGGLELGFAMAGAEIAFHAEIDPHASATLERRFPGVPNLGDIRQIGAQHGPIDVTVGGFPCQDVSVAGRREGLDGDRSGLWFEFRRVIAETRPRWVLVENVPGLLSSNKGRDFAVVIQGLVELGYSVSWRILDAQYFGVPQRRRRVFIVGSLGNGRSAEVLFERESVRGDSPPSRTTGQDVAGTLGGSSQGGGFRTTDLDGSGANVVAQTLTSSYAKSSAGAGNNPVPVNLVAAALTAAAGHHGHSSPRGDGSDNLIVAPTLTGRIRPRSKPGSDPLVISRRGRPDGVADEIEENISPALRTGGGGSSASQIVFDPRQITLGARDVESGAVQVGKSGVRRLTPTECERLQGFPDGWTEGQADTHRYKQLGNAVAVPVAYWIARRIVKADEELLAEQHNEGITQ